MWGYNYNVELDYDIKFSGTNIPTSGLWTLQGTISCGTTKIFFDLPNSSGNGTVVTTSNPYNTNSDCATATVQSLNCNDINIEICGPGISNQTIYYPSNPVPIELGEFYGSYNNGMILINWITFSEINNELFLLLKSNDGIEFTEIFNTSGAGNSSISHSYKFIDYDITSNMQYYKLKQIDFNGNSSESKIIVVETENNNSRIIIKDDYINILFVDNTIEYRVIITDLLGKIIFSKYFYGINSVNISNILSSGSYIISVVTENDITIKKFTIY